MSQREAAAKLGISTVHLCNLEKEKTNPSPELLTKYRAVFGVDVYVLAWCLFGDKDLLPPSIQAATERLTKLWLEDTADLVKGSQHAGHSESKASRLSTRVQ